jgi:hypothetical protein
VNKLDFTEGVQADLDVTRTDAIEQDTNHLTNYLCT